MASPFAKNILKKKAPEPKATNSTLASTVVETLKHSALSQINFKLGNVEISGIQFAQVAQAVESSRIKCWTVEEFESQGDDDLPDGKLVNARYKIERNAMLFSRENFGKASGEDQTIVHESVHAALDLSVPVKKTITTLRIEDEAAAILATAFYIKLSGKEEHGFKLGGGGEAEALELAEQAIRDPGVYTVVNGRFVFTPEELEPLRYAVSVSRNYRKFIDKADGLPTDRSGAKYTYDGVALCGK